jgi:hypothetical protein
MAYKDAKTGGFVLTPAEQTAAINECVYEPGYIVPHLGRTARWDDLDKSQQLDTIRAYLRKHPERLPPDNNELPGAKSGVTQSQLDWIVNAINDAMIEALPGMVKTAVEAMVTVDNLEFEARVFKELHQTLESKLQVLENKFSRGVETKQLSPAQLTDVTAQMAKINSRLDDLAEQFAKSNSTVDSVRHRQDRQQNQLANHETDLKDLKRKL